MTGNCWQGDFGVAENRLTGRWRCSGEDAWQEFAIPIAEDHTYAVALHLEGFDYTRSYILEVQVQDLLQTVSATTTLQRGLPVFDWGENYFNFHVPVHFGAGTTGLT